MVTERMWPLVLPLFVVFSLFVTLSLFGLFRLMPDWLRLAVAVAFAAAALAALYPLRYFRMPRVPEVDRRIEFANHLEHTPVSVQADRLSGGDAFSQALWREHQKRMAERLDSLSSDLPHTRVPERDPWGLRAAAALLLVIALAFSLSPFGGALGDAFRAHVSRDVIPPRIDAWVTPPPYTGKAPMYLTSDTNRGQNTFTVPQGSDVTLRVTGGSGEETLDFTDVGGEAHDIEPAAPAAATTARDSAGVRQFSAKLDNGGVLTLKSGLSDVESWSFSVIPDQPPVIEFADEPKRAVNGALVLTYTIEDDYGAAAARAGFALAEPPAHDARPLYEAPEMPLTLPRRGARNNAAKTTRDLTEHPWAGSPVRLTLHATDAAEQEAQSETKTLVLPERPFSNPLARALIEQRSILALDANMKRRVLDLMDAITLRPEDTFDAMAHYLAIRSAYTRLTMAHDDDKLREVVDYLWDIALGIEDGELSAAEKRLRQAQEALKKALEEGASDEEIEQMMAELREAMQDFLREFAERAMQNPDQAMQMPQNGQELRQSDLERMLDQIEELAKSGARDQAQELLSQLENMMNNLQADGQQQPGQQGQQGEMRQQMDKLGELMREQQQMMNETFRLDQMQRGQRQRGQEGQQGQPGQQGEQGQQGQGGMSDEQIAEALRQLQEGQGQLQGDLEALMEGLEGLGVQPGEGFGEAGEAMGDAGEALGEAEGERAVGEQGRALEALRRGAQDMMQQMMQAMQGEQGQGMEGGRQRSADRDPLGRPRATTGPDFGDSVEVPDEIDVQRARRILGEIRKRLGNALSPELERQYLERLLELR
jgi:uncharacterized protein (TIGR02302 family)